MNIIHRSKDIEVVGRLRNSFAGRFRVEAFQGQLLPDGRVIELPNTRHVLAEWFDNLITDGGLDRIFSGGGYLNYCHIGTGTATETVSDTALQSFERSQNSKPFDTFSAQGSAPYYGSRTITYRFNPPGVNKIYAEMGISWQATNGGLFSRARVKDLLGAPTTIEWLANEFLDVNYQLRNYPDALTLEEYVVDTYDIDFLAARVTQASDWGQNLGSVWTDPSGAFGSWRVYGFGTVLGPVTGIPTLTSTQLNGSSKSTYVPGSRNIDVTYIAGPTEANTVSGGIHAARFFMNLSQYQAAFDPPIPKTDPNTLNITLNYSAARATI